MCVSSTCHVTQRHCHADNARQAGGSQSSSIFFFLPPRGRFATFRILHFIYIFNVTQVVLPLSLSLSLSLADIRNLPLQINCQVMAVTSLLPASPPPSLLLPLFLFINARVNAMISLLSLLACCEIFYAQFMLIWPQFSHKGIRQQLPLSPPPVPLLGYSIFLCPLSIFMRDSFRIGKKLFGCSKDTASNVRAVAKVLGFIAHTLRHTYIHILPHVFTHS